jgi:hypothetical protein
MSVGAAPPRPRRRSGPSPSPSADSPTNAMPPATAQLPPAACGPLRNRLPPAFRGTLRNDGSPDAVVPAASTPRRLSRVGAAPSHQGRGRTVPRPPDWRLGHQRMAPGAARLPAGLGGTLGNRGGTASRHLPRLGVASPASTPRRPAHVDSAPWHPRPPLGVPSSRTAGRTARGCAALACS